MGRGAAAAAVAAAVLAAAASGASSPGLIVFSATPQTALVAQLYSIHPDGRGLKQLTSGPNAALAPALSPDGTRIAFARLGSGIFTVGRDGHGLRRLTANGRDGYPTWSPDGTRIAFVRPLGVKWRVFVAAATGGTTKQLTRTPPAGRPSWQQKGLLIPTAADLITVDSSTGRVRHYFDADIDAIWGLNSVGVSPAVSQLTYVGARASDSGDRECGEGACQRFGLYLESLAGKRHVPRLIVKDAGPAAFSPDGGRLAYVVGGALVIRSIASGGTTVLRTPNATPATAAPPAWR